MKKFPFLASLVTVLLLGAASLSGRTALACSDERTFGADWMQAKTNCELILKGQAHDCQWGGNNLWYCSCSVGCGNPGGVPDGNFTRTFGADWMQARTNCELILKGTANNCQPGGNNLWYCDCYY